MYKEQTISIKNFSEDVSVSRLTAIWAFSESAFGGILHAISVPFRGLFINAASVLIITLMAIKSSSRQILKSTLIVVIIKALVSPHSPLTAHFAVSTQGLIGSVLFRTKRFFRLSAFMLGSITLLLSGIQKIIILTLLFGYNFWKSIDIFIKQISKEFFQLGIPKDYQFGYIIIGIYISIHLIAGFFIGYYAGLLPRKLKSLSERFYNLEPNLNDFSFPKKIKKNRRKSWMQRPSGIIILTVLFLIMIYSYFFPYKTEIKSIEVLIMIIRAFSLTILWYFVMAPLIKKLYSKFISAKKNLYSGEVDEIVNLFPKFREIVSFSWNQSKQTKGFKRIKNFLSTSFYYLLFCNQEEI